MLSRNAGSVSPPAAVLPQANEYALRLRRCQDEPTTYCGSHLGLTPDVDVWVPVVQRFFQLTYFARVFRDRKTESRGAGSAKSRTERPHRLKESMQSRAAL